MCELLWHFLKFFYTTIYKIFLIIYFSTWHFENSFLNKYNKGAGWSRQTFWALPAPRKSVSQGKHLPEHWKVVPGICDFYGNTPAKKILEIPFGKHCLNCFDILNFDNFHLIKPIPLQCWVKPANVLSTSCP